MDAPAGSQPHSQPHSQQAAAASLPRPGSQPVLSPQKLSASQLGAPSTEREAKLSKGEAARHFTPSHVVTSREEMSAWIQAPLTGNLNEVPGIGHANQEHLFRQSAEAEKMKGFGAGDCVETTFQLLGKYMMFRSPGVSNVDNANLFFEWLKTKGISSHRQDIVEAVALKVNAMFGGGFYDPADFVEK